MVTGITVTELCGTFFFHFILLSAIISLKYNKVFITYNYFVLVLRLRVDNSCLLTVGYLQFIEKIKCGPKIKGDKQSLS